MTEVAIDAVSQKTRDLFNKGFSALERGRLDYAIDMLAACLQDEPGFLQARRFLRAAEIQRYKGTCKSSLSRWVALVTSFPNYPMAWLKVQKGAGQAAVLAVDKLLRKNPLCKHYMLMFAHAAEGADLPEAAVQMLEIGREHHVDDTEILEGLGEAYIKGGRPKKAIACYERVCEMRPNDPAALKSLKDAMALDSLSSDWAQAGEGGSYRDMMRDSDEAQRLEQEVKAVKSFDDLDDLIADAKAKIAEEPQNTNYYRSIARLYVQKKEFDLGEENLQKAIELAPGDAEIENAMADLRVKRFDAEVTAMREQGDEAAAKAKENERDQFYFDELQDRVRRYPNDLMLRYKLGVVMFENDYITEAIQEFQLAQRNAKNRARALHYLGLCFMRKGQYDMATQQLRAAAAEMPRMDEVKKDIIYALGEIAEKTGDTTAAMEHFKEIYQVDIRYRDVAEKVEKGYPG